MQLGIRRGTVGEPGGGSFSVNRLKRALETELLSQWELCEGDLEGGLYYWVLGYVNEGAGNGHLHRGPVGEPGEGRFVYR
jgi:hypothetical protein